jgi:hypothetical protein
MSFYNSVKCKGTASRRWVGRGDVACREETDSSRSRCRTGIYICSSHTYGFRSNDHYSDIAFITLAQFMDGTKKRYTAMAQPMKAKHERNMTYFKGSVS